MSGNTKMHPFGATLAYSTDNVTYTTLTDLAKVTPPNQKRAMSKATTLSSPSKTKEVLPSWRDPGEIPFTLYLTQTQYNTILGFYGDEVVRYFKVTAPLIGAQVTGATWVGQAFVSEVGTPEWVEEGDDLAMVECKFAVTGVITFTPGS